MKVIFGKPLDGWIQLDIKSSDQSFADSLSYIPEDFIYKLIETLNVVSSSEGQFNLEAYSEPVIYNFTFERKGNDVSFDISYKEKGNYKNLFHYSEPKNEMLLTFFRALSKMGNSITADEYEKNWHYEFPKVKLQQLKSYLKPK